MFSKGSYVIDRAEGVCVISDIKTEKFNALDKETQFYILNPINDKKSMLYVPVDNEALTDMMRPLLSAEEIMALADELRQDRIELVSDSRGRNSQLRDILSRGDRRELIVLLNTLDDFMERVAANGRKIGNTELVAYTRATKLLVDEFSSTTDIDNAEKLKGVIKGTAECLSK